MRITADGQVTIPQEIRERLGLLPDTEVELDVVDDWVRVRRTRTPAAHVWAAIEHMRGRATSGLSTDEIMAMTRGDEHA